MTDIHRPSPTRLLTSVFRGSPMTTERMEAATDGFPPLIRATIEAFFKDPLLGVAADDHIGELATELELQYPDLSVADAEKIAREAVAERSGTSSEAH